MLLIINAVTVRCIVCIEAGDDNCNGYAQKNSLWPFHTSSFMKLELLSQSQKRSVEFNALYHSYNGCGWARQWSEPEPSTESTA